MPDVAGVIIGSKSCSSYSVVSELQEKREFTCNVCQGLYLVVSFKDVVAISILRNACAAMLNSYLIRCFFSTILAQH